MDSSDGVGEGPEILIERRGNVALLTINRPRIRNALGLSFGENLLHALLEVEADESVLAVVLAGAGPIFSAGAKIGESIGENVDKKRRDASFRNLLKAMSAIRNLEIPVICALNGTTVGGGVSIALACDIVVAAEDAAYLFAFGRVGASAADLGCAHMLPRIVGVARARHILLGGLRVDAQMGKEYGLFAEIVPKERLLETALKIAENVASTGPRAAIAATKQVVLRGENIDFETCLYYENFLQKSFLDSDESVERVQKMLKAMEKASAQRA